MRRAGWAAAARCVGWYAFALALLHPLADAPVADSWIYGSAGAAVSRTGEIRFAGYTETMPVAQVIYGAGWAPRSARNSISLDLSMVRSRCCAALIFHALAIRCGARPMAGACGDRVADLQSVLHVPQLFVHERNSVPGGADRSASGVRQCGRRHEVVAVAVGERWRWSHSWCGRSVGWRSSARRCDADFRCARQPRRIVGIARVDQDDGAVRGRASRSAR